MARSLRKTTGSHLSLTSNSTQWDTRHAWHTQVKDRSASQPQGILAAMPGYSRTASEISAHNGRETPLTQIWKKMTKYTLYILERRFRIRISENITLVCINTDNLGFGLQIFWAVDCVWRVLPTNMRRDEPQSSGLCCWGFLRADRGGEANTMGDDVSHSKLEKLLVAFW